MANLFSTPYDDLMVENPKTPDELIGEILDVYLRQRHTSSREYAEARSMIINAYNYAKNAHEGQKRKSEEPYITHPVRAAHIIASRGADYKSIAGELLHDTVEESNGTLTVKDIYQAFKDPEIAALVYGMTKTPNVSFANNTTSFLEKAGTLIRLIEVKLGDNTHNCQTYGYFKKPEKRQKQATESLTTYVPMAEQTGAYDIMYALQDMSFRHINEGMYDTVRDSMKESLAANEEIIEVMLKSFSTILRESGAKGDVAFSRRGIYELFSLSGFDVNYRGIPNSNITLAPYDWVFKVVSEDEKTFYDLLGKINSNYPHERTILDYLGENRKSTGFESLITNLRINGIDSQHIASCQIRTPRMDRVARYGMYSLFDTSDELREHAINNVPALADLKLRGIKTMDTLLGPHIYVRTNDGDPIILPVGATSVDASIYIHTGITLAATSAIIDGKKQALNMPLRDGCTLYINQAPAGTEVNYGLLEQAATTTAAHKVLRRLKNHGKTHVPSKQSS